MSAFTERGASSSSINLMNSSTRLPEGAAMQKPRTGKVLSAGFSAAARFKVPTSSRHIQFFAKFDFEVMFDISTVRSSSVQTHPSGGACRLRGRGLGRFLSVFPPDAIESDFHKGSPVHWSFPAVQRIELCTSARYDGWRNAPPESIANVRAPLL